MRAAGSGPRAVAKSSCRNRFIWSVLGSDQREEKAMRELILAMSVSLDSFVSGPEGDIKWIFSGDQEAIAWKGENAWNASLHIMGSRVFQGMAAFWPTAATVFAPPMNQIPKAVFSKQDPAIL